MSEVATHTAPAKGGPKSGRLFRLEEPAQLHARKESAFFSDEAEVQPMFIPGIHRAADTDEEVQTKCAACEQEETIQKHAKHPSDDDENLLPKCAECEQEEAVKQEVNKSEDVQPKCDACENEQAPAIQPLPVQASLRVGKPDDPREKEADRMGEQVMRMPRLSFTGGGGIRPEGNNNTINRSEDEEAEVQTKLTPGLQRTGDGAIHTTNNFTSRLKTSGQGQPLSAPVRQDMEHAFNADFSAVRIHTGTEAASMSEDIGAQAFAHNNNIYFAENKYQPESSEGRFLLAHELTHTVQTGAAPIQQKAEVQRDDDDESWWDKLRNGAEYILSAVLPAAIYQFYLDVKEDGLLGYVKKSLFSLFKTLFNGIGFSDEEFLQIVQIFVDLKSQLPAIVEALGRDDCAPLFAALRTLSDVVGTIAGRVWDRVMTAIEPLRQWLNHIWDTYMAPALDRITAFAGELWDRIKNLGRWVWDKFYTYVIEPYYDAWLWICDKLGFGESSGSEGGFLSYVSGKLGEAWNWVKEQARPVIEPIQQVVEGIGSLINLDAVRRLQEEAAEWLNHAAATATAMGNDDDAVANQQLTLRQVLLPALNRSIDRVKGVITAAGNWVAEKINNIAGYVTNFFSNLSNNEYLSPVVTMLMWIPNAIHSAQDWATDKVQWLFDRINAGMELIRAFMDRVLNMLLRLVDAAGNLLGYLGDFILGPLNLVPKCIKDPIVNWLTEVILKKIPVIAEFIELAEKWPRIRAAALTVLQQVFVDGKLARGLWTFFRNLLSILGIDPTLVTSIIAKAATNFARIITHPGDFLKNVFNVIKGGFSRFFNNIGTHLLTGALDWLFGEVNGAVSVPPPADFSLGSILGYIMDLFGITKENIYHRMEENPRIGPEKVAKIRKMENMLTGALEWITVWVKEGAAGLLRKAQEKLNDLKDMVINGIIGWITTKVSASIMQRLATSADPLGIGATINTIILVYDTLKTAVAYINRMLNIANQAMDNLAEIINGQLEHAQIAFEEVLGKAVPVVVGFAVEVIIGPVGDKIQEIVSAGREKVDQAIDWLINGALNAIDTIINFGRAAADKILGWLGLRQQFKVKNGETHTLFFQGSDEKATLMIASTVSTFDTWIDAVPGPDPKTPEGQDVLKVKKEAKDIQKKIDIAKAVPRAEPGTPAEAKQVKTIRDLLKELAEKVGPLFENRLPECSSVANHEVKFDPKVGPGYGKKMVAPQLTKKGKPAGSPPRITPSKTFNSINRRRKGKNSKTGAGVSYYKLGHLLNENFGGPGTIEENLTPISGKTNGTHEARVEDNVRQAIDKGNIVEYEVDVIYNDVSGQTKGLQDAVMNDMTITQDKATICEIIKDEESVASILQCKAFLVDPVTKLKTQFLSENINARPDQTPGSYDLTGLKINDVWLDVNDADKLKEIGSPMDDELAKAVIAAINDKKTTGKVKRFASKDDLRDHKLANGTPAFPGALLDKIKIVLAKPYVKLYKG